MPTITWEGDYDVKPHTFDCDIWFTDDGKCDCGALARSWRGKDRGVPHPEWYDGEIVRRLHAGEILGRPVSEREGLAAVAGMVARGMSVLAMADAMGVDRRWVDGWIAARGTVRQ